MNEKLKKILAGVGVLGAFGLGGAAIAGAQGDQPPSKSAGSQVENVKGEASEQDEANESEKNVTGVDADRAGQAALKSVGSGKVLEVERETPEQGADQPEPGDKPDSAKEQAIEQKTAYEVEVQTSDGSTVEVALDDAFNALGSEQEDDEQETENSSEQVGAQR